MRDWFNVFVWKHTGWVPNEWARRDNYVMQNFWMALVEARQFLYTGDTQNALSIIEEALK